MQCLNSICIPAIAITDVEDQEIIHQVLNGSYLVVYGSTECLSTVMEGHLQKRKLFRNVDHDWNGNRRVCIICEPASQRESGAAKS